MPLTPSQIQKLCQQLIDCKDEAVARKLSEELRVCIHELIESLRVNLPAAAIHGTEFSERQSD
jgi:hypothetical protein